MYSSGAKQAKERPHGVTAPRGGSANRTSRLKSAAPPLVGYRHWASADESQLDQFGDVSYMMAVKLSTLQR